jgi:hypothetical protein
LDTPLTRVGKPEGKIHLKGLGVDERIILKGIIKK